MENNDNFVVETVKNDKKFQFVIPNGASWGAVIDAAYDFLNYSTNMAHEHVKKIAQQAQEDKDASK